MDKNKIQEKDFYDIRHYKRFMLAVKYAEKVNEYLDKGYIVFNGYNTRIDKEFKINLQIQMPKTPILITDYVVYYGYHFIDNKIFIEDTLKDIRDRFMKFQIFNPNKVIKLGEIK